jgi:uncharacterized protein (TIGR03084 family)
MEQATDFFDESEALATILGSLSEGDWDRPTQFKGWTINDVIVHLHYWNRGADLALTDPDRFQAVLGQISDAMMSSGLRAFENAAVRERGPELFANWRALYTDMGERWARLDPKLRVKWAGPDMSVRSSMTARQMETWAHGQEVFDLLGVRREEHDRIRNIVVLGVNAFGWSFKVHGRDVPQAMPFLILTAPSGAVWEFGETDRSNRISGPAVEFAQVVTQTRNIADTSLVVEGPVATSWMADAQCFAGPPETPPAPGARFVA